jgi:hypothetical protein
LSYGEILAALLGLMATDRKGETMETDKRILEIALRQISLALDALAAECTDDTGKPKAPSQQTLMRSRGLLPPYCNMALAKKVANK